MKILLIRHGEPDYALDCLTENGILQAGKLAKRLKSENIKEAYMSPMGRAQETAHICMDGTGIPLTQCDWLHEFDVKVWDKSAEASVPVWDLNPQGWTPVEELYDRKNFFLSDDMKNSEIGDRFKAVADGLDELLAKHGLVRKGGVYEKVGDCDETIALFCHFGVTCVMIAYLLGISPVVMLQGLSADPTAIAAVCTDDRFGNFVNFRLHGFGDVNHLGVKAGGTINYQ